MQYIAGLQGDNARKLKQLYPKSDVVTYVSLIKQQSGDHSEYCDFAHTQAMIQFLSITFKNVVIGVADTLQWRNILADRLKIEPQKTLGSLTDLPTIDALSQQKNITEKVRYVVKQMESWEEKNKAVLDTCKQQARRRGDSWSSEMSSLLVHANVNVQRWDECLLKVANYANLYSVLQKLLQQEEDDSNPNARTFLKTFIKSISKRHPQNGRSSHKEAAAEEPVSTTSEQQRRVSSLLLFLDISYLFEECIEFYSRAESYQKKNAKAILAYPEALLPPIAWILERCFITSRGENIFHFMTLDYQPKPREYFSYTDAEKELQHESPRNGGGTNTPPSSDDEDDSPPKRVGDLVNLVKRYVDDAVNSLTQTQFFTKTCKVAINTKLFLLVDMGTTVSMDLEPTDIQQEDVQPDFKDISINFTFSAPRTADLNKKFDDLILTFRTLHTEVSNQLAIVNKFNTSKRDQLSVQQKKYISLLKKAMVSYDEFLTLLTEKFDVIPKEDAKLVQRKSADSITIKSAIPVTLHGRPAANSAPTPRTNSWELTTESSSASTSTSEDQSGIVLRQSSTEGKLTGSSLPQTTTSVLSQTTGYQT